MVTDVDIARRLTSVLRNADLSITTTTAIRKQLERELSVDLTDRKAFIREQVDLYLKEHQEEAEQREDDGEVAGEPQEEEQEEQEQEEEEEEEQEQEKDEKQAKPIRKTRKTDHEPDSKRFKARIHRAIKESLPKEKKKRVGGGGGLKKACSLSPELQAIIGEPELPRTQVVKQLWVYIRENELQDPENRRKILCNDELRGLFGVDSTDIFKMNKLLSKHIWPLDRPADVVEPKAKKVKTEKASSERPKTEKKGNEKQKAERKDSDRQKTEKKESGRGRSSSLVPLSDALVEFLGTDETEMEQHNVVKSMWDYIAAHKLQDPADKRTIVCDEMLQDLFGCDTFDGFDLTKLLAPHLKG